MPGPPLHASELPSARSTLGCNGLATCGPRPQLSPQPMSLVPRPLRLRQPAAGRAPNPDNGPGPYSVAGRTYSDDLVSTQPPLVGHPHTGDGALATPLSDRLRGDPGLLHEWVHLICGAERYCWNDAHRAGARDDVVRVARNREPGVHLEQIAADSGISESCLTKLVQAGRRRGGRQARDHHRAVSGRAGVAQVGPVTGAGERGLAPRCGLSVAGQPAGKGMYPLVRELAAPDATLRVPVAGTWQVLMVTRQPYHP